MQQPILVTVTNIEKNTPDSAVITLQPPAEHKDDFAFQAGQYIVIKKSFDDEELRRCYSICADEQSGMLQIGVKQVDDGAFSSFANQQLQIGTQLEIFPPSGRFILDEQAKNYLMIAAGSGITPIISQIQTLLQADKDARITLIYGNKTPHSTMFRERLEDLKNRYLQRFNLVNILSQTPQDIELFSGRITGDKVEEIISNWLGGFDFQRYHICGPIEMIKSVKATLTAKGVDKTHIKNEIFAATKRKNAPAVKTHDTVEKMVEVNIMLDGSQHRFQATAGQAVLQTALANNLDVPFSCQSGICSTCRCKILAGSGTMAVNNVLEDYEVRAGYALSCQLVPDTDSISVSYDGGH